MIPMPSSPANPGDDAVFLRVVLGMLEEAAAAAPDHDLLHKRDSIQHRFFFRWGAPPLTIGIAAHEDLVLEHPLVVMSGAARAGRYLMRRGVERILEGRKPPDQVTSAEGSDAWSQVGSRVFDIRWRVREGTIALMTTESELDTRGAREMGMARP